MSTTMHTVGPELGRRLTHVVACDVDWDTVPSDLDAAAAEMAVRGAAAESRLVAAVADSVATIPRVPSEAIPVALEEADRLIRTQLVPVSKRGSDRARAGTAGWLAVAAGCERPDAVASLLSVESAPRTLLRLASNGTGPQGRYLDLTPVDGDVRKGGVLLVGLPASGKTALLKLNAATAVGPVVAGTPNVADIHAFAARASDHDVLVYDPGGLLGRVAPPGVRLVRLDPVSLVREWQSGKQVAAWMAHAADGPGLNDRFWTASAARVLAMYMFAAATSGDTIYDVANWAEGSDEATVIEALADAGDDRAVSVFTGYVRTVEPTQTGIASTVRTTVDPYVNTDPAAELLDIEKFLDDNATLVMLADPNISQGSLQEIGFVTSQIIQAKWRRAGTSPRRGAPLLVLADEVTRNPAFGDLGRLLAEGPSRGVQIVAATQNTAQLRAYGPAGPEEVLTACSRVLLFEGSMSRELLSMAPYMRHEEPTGWVTDGAVGEESHGFSPNHVAEPGAEMVSVVEPGRPIRRAHVHAAHRHPLWRLASLDATFSRAAA